MGIVGEPPTLASLYTSAILILAIGILDFISPEMHVSSVIIGFIGVMVILYFFITCRNLPEPTIFHVTEADGTKHDEFYMDNPTSFKTLLIGIGLSIASLITWILPWTRLTSLIFIISGTYACSSWIWIFYEVHLKKEVK
jgi:hypothetical protein